MAEEELERRRGGDAARGRRQRATAEKRFAEAAGGGDPGYADELLLGWGFGDGIASAQGVQKHAGLARRAGACGGLLKELAELGACGRHPGNCSVSCFICSHV